MKVFTTKWLKQLCLPFITQLIICASIYAQGFSPSVQTRLQHIIDSFQNNLANPFVGGMSVAIKVDGLAMWQGATGYAARNVDAQNNLLPGGTPFKKICFQECTVLQKHLHRHWYLNWQRRIL